MRFAPKIFLVSALVILVLGGVAGWSLRAVNELVEVNRGIATRSVPAIETTSGLPESFRRLVRLEAKYLVLRDRLDDYIKKAEGDSVRFYFLCEDCQKKVERIGGEVPHQGGTIIV